MEVRTIAAPLRAKHERRTVVDEIVIKLKAEYKPGFQCPNCGGTGRMADGMMSVSPTEIRIKAATQCGLCLGKGRVRCVPLGENE